jgi:hypothetical protein
MIAVEVKGMDPKYSWEIIGIYRAPNEDMLAIERLAARTLLTRNSTKRSIIGGYLNLPQANWNGDAGKTNGFQTFVNKVVSVPEFAKPHFSVPDGVLIPHEDRDLCA